MSIGRQFVQERRNVVSFQNFLKLMILSNIRSPFFLSQIFFYSQIFYKSFKLTIVSTGIENNAHAKLGANLVS